MSPNDLVRNSLRDTLRQRIEQGLADGTLDSGTSLKPVRDLAAEHAVSYVTMQRALKDLERDGLVEVRRGSGVYVRSGREGPSRASAKHPRVALVEPPWTDTHAQRAVMQILQGFLRTAAPHRWHVELVYSAPGTSTSLEFLDEILWRKPDGIAWVRPTAPQVVHLARLADRGYSVCACGRHFPGAPYPSYSYDMEDFAGQALRWGRAHGGESVTVLDVLEPGYPDPMPAAIVEAFRRAAAREGASPDYVRVLAVPRRPRHPRDTYALELLREHDPADMVVCPYQRTLRYFSELDEGGFWDARSRPTLVDLNQYYTREGLPDLSAFDVLRADFVLESEGASMAQYFLWKWAGAPEPDPDVFRATLTHLKGA